MKILGICTCEIGFGRVTGPLFCGVNSRMQIGARVRCWKQPLFVWIVRQNKPWWLAPMHSLHSHAHSQVDILGEPKYSKFRCFSDLFLKLLLPTWKECLLLKLRAKSTGFALQKVQMVSRQRLQKRLFEMSWCRFVPNFKILKGRGALSQSGMVWWCCEGKKVVAEDSLGRIYDIWYNVCTYNIYIYTHNYRLHG